MSQNKKKKYLLALDGSDRAMDAVRYIARLKPFHHSHITLFNVFAGVPESYWDLEKDPQFTQSAREVRAWEMQQRKVINEYMEKAKELLVRSGFLQDDVRITVQNRKRGIARDILKEAENFYHALIIGRKGFGTYKEIIIGSIANKLIDRALFLPVLMIGQIPPDENILLAVDASEGAMRAVDFVAATLCGYDFNIHLFNAIRGTDNSQTEFSHLFFPKELVQKAEEMVGIAFEDAKKRLVTAGFASNQITSKIVKGVYSRAESIIQEAREKDFGTIVLGRRGHSTVKDFIMGRVSNKVVHTIRNRTIWVIT